MNDALRRGWLHSLRVEKYCEWIRLFSLAKTGQMMWEVEQTEAIGKLMYADWNRVIFHVFLRLSLSLS